MDLKENLLLDMKEALKARNSLKLNTIHGLISEIKNREIDLRRKLDNDEIISLVSTQIKKRKEAATMFDEGGSDLSEKENQEMIILQEYLPEQVSEQELKDRIQKVILELGIVDIKDLGRIMKIVIPEFKGRADSGQIRNLVAEYLKQ